MLEILSGPEGDSDVSEEHGLDDSILCAECSMLVTRTRWRLSMGGEHEHTFFNPAGNIFRVLCFRESPGVSSVGNPSNEFTWFKKYLWTFSLCLGCGGHLGWRYEGDAEPRIFFGLIKAKLSHSPPS